jgi:uncharacterized protein
MPLRATMNRSERYKMARFLTLAACLPLLLALSAGRAGAAASEPMTPQITAQGTADVRAAPDRAVVRFGVQVDAPEAQAAQARVGEAMQRVIQALRQLSIPENRIGTERLDLSPVYEQTGSPVRPGPPRLTGYHAANVVRVELDDLARLGPVIDAAVGAGANEVEGIQFAVANEAPYRAQALRQASAEARVKAQAIAEALGVHLGDLIEASEGGVEVTPPRPVFFERAAGAATPVQPGEMTVRATVTVRYGIAGIKKEP